MKNKNHENLILTLFSLSISAHNVQPFRLKILSEDKFEIWADAKRLLPIADPHERDLQIGLGALIETLEIGLSAAKIRLTDLNIEEVSLKRNEKQFVLASFSLAIDESLILDPLEKELAKRFSYRGKFKNKVNIEANETCGNDISLIFLKNLKDKNAVGNLYDKINLKFLSLPGYIDELYSWMRFSKNHKQWPADGLNAESMGLSLIESFGASIILRPAVFKPLKKINIISHLIVELPIIETSSAVVAITGPGVLPIDIGRGFMRGWLKLTALGLYGAPLSLLTDDKESMLEMREQFKLSPKEHIYNILRVGPLPMGFKIPERARLNKEELYV